MANKECSMGKKCERPKEYLHLTHKMRTCKLFYNKTDEDTKLGSYFIELYECPRKEQPKNYSVQRRLVEGLEAVPELDGEITLKILVGLALASQQSICPLLQRIGMLGGSNSSCCPRDPPRISGSRKLIDYILQF